MANEDFLFSVKVGTPLYNAPEQEQCNNYNQKVDCFAIGIILYESLSNFKTDSGWIKNILKIKQTGQVDEKFWELFP